MSSFKDTFIVRFPD